MKHSVRESDPPRAPLAPDPARRRLSRREREIALLVGEGLKDLIIARRLGIGVGTVQTHICRAQFRLGLDGRAALAAGVARRRDRDRPEAGLRRGTDDHSR